MKKQILSEVNRVREIMGFTILEQKKEIVKVGEEKGEYIELDTIIFNSTYKASDDKTSQEMFNLFLNKLLESIGNNSDANDAYEKGTLELKSATVTAGASNYYSSAPTAADVMNDRVTPMPPLETEEGADGNPLKIYPLPYYNENEVIVKWDKNSKPYRGNLDLALRRADNFINTLAEKLPAISISHGLPSGISVFPQLSRIPNGSIVDTGGVIDKLRDKSAYPNPGQVIIADLTFGYVETIEVFEETCTANITIEISAGGPKGGHKCDEAIFSVRINGSNIGIANLNNSYIDVKATKVKNIKKDEGNGRSIDPKIYLPGLPTSKRYPNQRISDGQEGGVRTSVFTIDSSNPDLKWGEVNKIEIKSLVKPNGTFGSVQLGSRGIHADVPNVKITNSNGIATPGGENGFTPNVGMDRGSMKTTELLLVDKCGVPWSISENNPESKNYIPS